jgi:hypothetical protein
VNWLTPLFMVPFLVYNHFVKQYFRPETPGGMPITRKSGLQQQLTQGSPDILEITVFFENQSLLTSAATMFLLQVIPQNSAQVVRQGPGRRIKRRFSSG